MPARVGAPPGTEPTKTGPTAHLRLLLRVLRAIGVAGGGPAGERPVGIVRASGLHEGLGAGHNVGLGRGEVFRFREVAREIVEFERHSGAIAHGLPVAETDGLERLVGLVEFPVEIIALRCLAAFEKRDEREPVGFVTCRELGTGQLAATGTVSFEVLLDYNSDSNPFVHRYHPDHDNLDARFASVLPAGRESLTVKRQVVFTFLGSLPGVTDPAWGVTMLGGTYVETVTGLRSIPLIVKGIFILNRVTDASALLTP